MMHILEAGLSLGVNNSRFPIFPKLTEDINSKFEVIFFSQILYFDKRNWYSLSLKFYYVILNKEVKTVPTFL